MLERHYRDLADIVTPADPWPATVVSYGADPDQVGDIRIPNGPGPHPVVVVIHGGFWRMPWDRRLMNRWCDLLARAGFASWNIEYRRVGRGGGWPATFADCAAAADRLAELGPEWNLDLGRSLTLGHSAGGHLAVWLAARRRLPASAPGGAARLIPRAAISLAGCLDLALAFRDGTGAGAPAALMGGAPGEVPERYAVGSPAQQLPLGVAQLVVVADDDHDIPAAQAEHYAADAVRLGDRCDLTRWPGTHMDLLRPATADAERLVAWMRDRLS